MKYTAAKFRREILVAADGVEIGVLRQVDGAWTFQRCVPKNYYQQDVLDHTNVLTLVPGIKDLMEEIQRCT